MKRLLAEIISVLVPAVVWPAGLVFGQSTPAGMAYIRGGSFQMGNSFSINEGYTDEIPRHTVHVDSFYMDRTEVTNQQYAAALNWAWGQGNLITVTSNMVTDTGMSYFYCDTTGSFSCNQITWNGSTFGVISGRENYPMEQVSWHGAVAYANWRSAMLGRQLCYNLSTWNCDFTRNGYRLATEAEWEKAARGGASGHRFSWSDSNTIQHARANYYSISSYSYDTSPTRDYHPTFNTGECPYTSPVGYFAPNGNGLYDMTGNVWEWCNDRYDSNYYSSSPTNNPRGPASGSDRVLRGGGFDSGARICRVTFRYHGQPDQHNFNIGLRLVASTPIAFDLDNDGDVDQSDFGLFQNCLSGSSVAPPAGCEFSDFDGDNDVDHDDFGAFHACVSGPKVPADPDCGTQE